MLKDGWRGKGRALLQDYVEKTMEATAAMAATAATAAARVAARAAAVEGCGGGVGQGGQQQTFIEAIPRLKASM